LGREFENWTRERLSAGAIDELVAFRDKAPALRLAHPTDEHFLPLLVTLGATAGSRASFPIEGFEMGSMSRLAVRLG
jgi:4,5-DOPA dioxygenase extradiol